MHGLLSSSQSAFLRQPPGWGGEGGSAPSAPVNVAPCVVAFEEGETGLVGDHVIVGTAGEWDDVTATLSYQWYKNGVAISGATADRYTLLLADANAVITVVETATNGGGSTDEESSNSVTSLALAAPTNSWPCTILSSGSQFYLAYAGTWSSNPGADATYQWQEASDNVTWSDIPGATGPSYELMASSNYYRLVETFTNSQGSASQPSESLFFP